MYARGVCGGGNEGMKWMMAHTPEDEDEVHTDGWRRR